MARSGNRPHHCFSYSMVTVFQSGVCVLEYIRRSGLRTCMAQAGQCTNAIRPSSRAARDRPKGAPKCSVFWSNQWVRSTPSSPIKTAAQGGVFIWRWRQSSANPSLRQIPCLQGKIQGISAFSDSVFSPHSSETPAQYGSPAAKAPSFRNQNREFNFPDQAMNREFLDWNRDYLIVA